MNMRSKAWIYILSIIITLSVFCCTKENKDEPLILPPNTMADIDRNIYKTVTIGSQVWMAENLKVTHYRNGEQIPSLKQISWQGTEEGACCNLNDHPGNNETFGKLYNGFAVLDSRNIAPDGWHIPSNTEWFVLIDYLGGQMVAGGKLKDTSLNWMQPNIGATNESGFTALPGGCRAFDMLVDHGAYYSGFWWSSTEHDSKNIHYLQLNNYNARTSNLSHNCSKQQGLSIRCVKD